MMTRRRFLVMVGATAPIAAGAGLGLALLPGEPSKAKGPTVRWDEQSCDHCGMVISDRRYAAVWIEPGGTQGRFDDIGCMVTGVREHSPSGGTQLFVRDFASDRWLDAATSTYIRSTELRSPMAYAVAAFESMGAAQAELGDIAGRDWTWDAMLSELERLG